MIDWNKYRDFSREVDFPSGDPRPELLDKLQAGRDVAGVPFVVTSGLRYPDENAAAGGVENSSHIRGYAADLAVNDSHTRYCVLKGVFKAGIHRIGIYPTHIHVDCDPSLPPEVVWVPERNDG